MMLSKSLFYIMEMIKVDITEDQEPANKLQ